MSKQCDSTFTNASDYHYMQGYQDGIKQGRADAIDEIEDAIINSFNDEDNDNTVTVISVLHHIHEVLGSLKEKKDE